MWMNVCGVYCSNLLMGCTPAPIGQSWMTPTRRRGVPVWLASISLLVCCGTRTDSWGGPECPTGTVVGLLRTHTYDLQVSRETGSKAYLWRDYEFIHALPFIWKTKTLYRVGGAAEFESSAVLVAGFILTVCAGLLLWSRVLSSFCVSCKS